jgi:hypothetical protein
MLPIRDGGDVGQRVALAILVNLLSNKAETVTVD